MPIEQPSHVSIPLESSGVGHFHCQGSLNGAAIDVLIDTGAASTVVDRAIAEAAGLRMVALGKRGGGVGSAEVPLWHLSDATLAVGDLALENVRLIAMDFANVRAALAARGVEPPQVILGADVLRDRAAVIDYGTDKLWLAA